MTDRNTLNLYFTPNELQAIHEAVEREKARTKKDLREAAWGFQQIRNALGAWSRQREALADEGQLVLQQPAPTAPGQAPEPKTLRPEDVGVTKLRLKPPSTSPRPTPVRVFPILVPVTIWDRWLANYAVMVAVNRVWHGAFPFDTFEDWAEGLLRDAARASKRAAEAEEERQLIHEVYPELG
jgi:hypothetical protein